MCGRYVLSQPVEVIAEYFGVDPEAGPGAGVAQGLEPRYNIAPTQEAPIVRAGPLGRTLSLARWGLVPYWAEDASIGNRLINARSETADAKPAYREALRRRRCLVPADGFYEWKKVGRARQPFLFRPPAGHLVAIAGLWERWHDGPLTLETYTLLTTDANETVAPIHDRMPVLLEPVAFGRWLDPALRDPAELADLLVPSPAGKLEAVAVSTRVNDPANDDPACLEPLPTLFEI
jgi:putative SOS response-associated peptidase YedK